MSEDSENDTDFRTTKVKVTTKSIFQTKPLITTINITTEPPPAVFHFVTYPSEEIMERNSATIIPAFFSRLKLSNKTQDFISTVVNQLSSLQNRIDEPPDSSSTSEGYTVQTPSSQILPPYRPSTDTPTICNGIYCSPMIGLIRTSEATADSSITQSTVSQNYIQEMLSVSKSEIENGIQSASSLVKNIEDLLANTPTKSPMVELNANSLSLPNSKVELFTVPKTSPVSTNKPITKEIHSKTVHPTTTTTTSTTTTSASTTSTTATSRTTETYSYEEYDLETTDEETHESKRTSSTITVPETDESSKYKYVINPEDLAKQIDLYAILKSAAEDLMKQYLGALLTNSTLFPRLWADVKNQLKNNFTSSLIESKTDYPLIYEGWMRRPLSTTTTGTIRSIKLPTPTSKLTSYRPYVFRILNNKSQTKSDKNSIVVRS